MLNFIKEYVRNKALRDNKLSVNRKFLNIRDVNFIGFIFGVSSVKDVEELHRIAAFLNGSGISYSGLVVEIKRGIFVKAGMGDGESIDNPIAGVAGVTFIENDYINWVGVATSAKIDDFLKKEFDLFISFNGAGNFTLDYITRFVKAGFIAGMCNSRYNTCTLLLEGDGRTVLEPAQYLKQIFHYLNVIEPGT